MTENTTLIIALSLALVWGIFDKVQGARKTSLRKRRARRMRLRERADSLTKAVTDLTAILPPLKDVVTQSIGSTADANKFLAGTMTACETIASATDQLRETIANFSSIVSAPTQPSGYPADAFQEPPSEAHRQFMGDTFAQMIQHGVSEDIARQRVRDEEEKKTAISAVEFDQE